MCDRTDGEPGLKALVDDLVDGGHLRSTSWVQAFRATPRHLFTPRVLLSAAEGYRQVSGDDPATREE